MGDEFTVRSSINGVCQEHVRLLPVVNFNYTFYQIINVAHISVKAKETTEFSVYEIEKYTVLNFRTLFSSFWFLPKF